MLLVVLAVLGQDACNEGELSDGARKLVLLVLYLLLLWGAGGRGAKRGVGMLEKEYRLVLRSNSQRMKFLFGVRFVRYSVESRTVSWWLE